MSKKNEMEVKLENGVDLESEPARSEAIGSRSKPKPMKTVYTHGKVFKVPASKSLEEFLREKYPDEYK